MVAFVGTGVAGLIVDIGVYALASLAFPPMGARIVSIAVAITATWWINRRHTFRPCTEKSLRREYVQYVLSSLVGAGVNYGAFLLLLSLLPALRGAEYIGICLSSALAATVNFLLYKHLVFASSGRGRS